MNNAVTVTSKRQITIPAEMFRRLNLKKGDKMLIDEEAGSLKLTPAKKLIQSLAGSIETPLRFKGLAPDEIIEQAKKEYFNRS